MAEVLVVIAVVTEGAEMVKEVVGALQAAKDLLESFKKAPNRNVEVVAAIDQAKNKIISRIELSELKAQQQTLYVCNTFWYEEALPKLSKYPITPQSIADRGQLFDIDRQINTKKDEILQVTFFLNDARNNLPKTPSMFNMCLIAHHLLISILMLHRSLLASPGSTVEPDGQARILTGVNRALEATEAFVAGYQTARASQLVLKKEIEHKSGFFSGYYEVVQDTGGHSLVPKSEGHIFKTADAGSAVQSLWNQSEVGKTRLPALYAQWEAIKAGSTAL